MIHVKTAMKFLECFCAGDVEGLAPLLAEGLRFRGPLHQFGSRDAYLDSLRNDPPEKCEYRVLSVTQDEDSVSVYYDYEKSEGFLTVAQLFRFKDQQISELLLVFDARELG